MQKKALHIVSFDNPFPPVYGGIIEVFFKLKPLHELGIDIHFHCFVDVIPKNNPELVKITTTIHYYKNDKNPFYLFSKLPFSVKSRNSNKLVQNIKKIPAPIFFEGLKPTRFVFEKLLPDYQKILRLHNIEHDYFNGIASSETNIFKKWLFRSEALKFTRYESVIRHFDKTIALSKFENNYINGKFGKSVYIPVFHGNTKVLPLEGVGKYAIYHGDLRMSDNLRAVLMLIDVFKKITDFELVIASNSNERFIKSKIGKLANIRYVPIENFAHLKQLLREAQINLIYSFQKSGTKLKLMNALYNSRFCIINDNIMDDENVTQFCEFANSKNEIIDKINALKNRSFMDYEKRRDVLETTMNDALNAEILAKEIFESWN
ncbi:hypothetical protein FNO01nite_29850 [Flavobacterium noncentrifugens]|uniref:Uncharacterized protein n=1 Tax=Flavobacterium noncentrifugens TaxID=1128970 RepID=A0A1G9BN95_9FLAO|nr:hypothetical protein [Flavobacterium noncentrifugens]GEP52313.1 hypothetical protein FNO01nite_29850 [Flavobacterium noncentrifugens]SDK40981.1 hypothetical protein SAMN04487935_3295 [Flavobacterium noncentrifugens]